MALRVYAASEPVSEDAVLSRAFAGGMPARVGHVGIDTLLEDTSEAWAWDLGPGAWDLGNPDKFPTRPRRVGARAELRPNGRRRPTGRGYLARGEAARMMEAETERPKVRAFRGERGSGR
jgi:hypothetical protein